MSDEACELSLQGERADAAAALEKEKVASTHALEDQK